MATLLNLRADSQEILNKDRPAAPFDRLIFQDKATYSNHCAGISTSLWMRARNFEQVFG